jgi:hypothetical protein
MRALSLLLLASSLLACVSASTTNEYEAGTPLETVQAGLASNTDYTQVFLGPGVFGGSLLLDTPFAKIDGSEYERTTFENVIVSVTGGAVTFSNISFLSSSVSIDRTARVHFENCLFEDEVTTSTPWLDVTDNEIADGGMTLSRQSTEGISWKSEHVGVAPFSCEGIFSTQEKVSIDTFSTCGSIPVSATCVVEFETATVIHTLAAPVCSVDGSWFSFAPPYTTSLRLTDIVNMFYVYTGVISAQNYAALVARIQVCGDFNENDKLELVDVVNMLIAQRARLPHHRH